MRMDSHLWLAPGRLPAYSRREMPLSELMWPVDAELRALREHGEGPLL